ncbi:hypothetical protein HJG60_009217 [Phyllostomus discolor]|uniref:Uncharacterized protein n=1 Tax=Phyllostomus discolor TaxID=89673 RepID=A0A833YQ31_9CHIR|nr:hypothetical protein HJG60_009217 [Phyllostomus discolor]
MINTPRSCADEPDAESLGPQQTGAPSPAGQPAHAPWSRLPPLRSGSGQPSPQPPAPPCLLLSPGSCPRQTNCLRVGPGSRLATPQGASPGGVDVPGHSISGWRSETRSLTSEMAKGMTLLTESGLARQPGM